MSSSPLRHGFTSLVAGDIGITYGRNVGQRLMVASLVGELKVHVHPVLAKAELFTSQTPVRAYVGLGAGVTGGPGPD